VCELQTLLSLPLQIDTADPAAMEAAMRRYNGKAMIHSVNGTEKSMNAVFPLIKKYGGLAVALTQDENGIPETAEERLTVAKHILDVANTYGIAKKDILFDSASLAVSAASDADSVTSETLRRIRTELKAHTALDIAGISSEPS